MRRRLLIVLVAGGLVVLAGFAVPLLYTTSAVRTDRFVSTRTAELGYFADLASSNRNQVSSEIHAHFAEFGDPIAVYGADGRPIADTGSWPAGQELRARAAIGDALRNQAIPRPGNIWPWSPHRVLFARPVGTGTQVTGAVVMLASLRPAVRDVTASWELIILGVLGVAALFLVLALVLARWATRPVSQLARAMRAVEGGSAHTRVSPEQGPPEMRGLVKAFNSMVHAVEESARRQRAFVADASHQMRNPLAAVRLRMDLLAAQQPAAARAAYDSLVAETDRLEALLDGMLALASADAVATGLAVRGEAVSCDAVAVVRARIAFWQAGAAASGVTLTEGIPDPAAATGPLAVPNVATGPLAVPGPASGPASGPLAVPSAVSGPLAVPGAATVPLAIPGTDPATSMVLLCTSGELEQIMDVALDNAIKYAPGSTVVVTMERAGAFGRITVADDGPGVAGRHLPRLTERFWRVSRSGRGSGLGLSIADRQATARGGRLRITSVSPHGLAVTVELPRAVS